MKKIKIILLSILVSCGSSNNDDNQNSKINTKTEVTNTEKRWEEFTVKALGNTMSEMKFDVSNISVSEGSWVRITLINDGVGAAMLHNIVFVNYGTRKEVGLQSIDAGPEKQFVPENENVIAYSDLAKPGETVILEFKAPEKGNYEFICSYPGHSEIMRGYFFVK